MNLKAYRSALYWSLPCLFCLVLYWPGLKIWFHDDDFAFLGLLPDIHNWRDLSQALFQPTVHGTWRPLSERAYFIGVQALFGVPHALPFRIIAFLAQFANLILISAITRRLTGSRLAGFLAPVIWIANSALVTVMVWDSAFMYALCGLVFLSAFWFLLQYIETNHLRYYAAVWCIFLTGFLVMETNIVFPMLAATYTLLRARPYFRKILPLFLPSFAFFAAHQLLIHKQAGGPYAMHFDTDILRTFGVYWAMALNPLIPQIYPRFPPNAASAGVFMLTVALGGFVGYQAFRRNWLPTFFLAWFAIVLAPVLPLRDHISNYYLTLPLIGLSILGAYTFATAYRLNILWRSAAVALLALFLLESVPSARGAATWTYHRGEDIKHLVLGVAKAHRREPEKTILLDRISYDLFGTAVSQSVFRFVSIPDVYLAPGSETCMDASAQSEVASFVLPPDKTREALAHNRLIVLRNNPQGLIDITNEYGKSGNWMLDVADPGSAGQLGPTWYSIDQGFRWMPKCASVRLKGPASGCPTLYMSGYCPAAQLAAGPLGVTVSINGQKLPPAKIEKGDAQFELQFPAQPGPHGIYDIVVTVDRTFTSGNDRRALGLVFGRFEIR